MFREESEGGRNKMAKLINSSSRALFKIGVLVGYREFGTVQRDAVCFHVVLVFERRAAMVGGDSA